MITIIIPIYNCEKYLSAMLDCVLHQSFTDYEVIMVDDGSSDSTGEICNRYADEHKNFSVIHQNNQGVSAARNNAMKLARGEFITFLDADDEIPNDYFAKLVESQKATNADITVCDVVILSDGAEVNRFTCGDKVLSREEALNYLLSREYINSGPYAKLFRKSLIEALSFPPLKAYEDILFVTDAFNCASVIAVTCQTEYRYIQNSAGAMSSFSKCPSMDVMKATERLISFIKVHDKLSPKCFYITLSHLMQYVQSLSDNNASDALIFKKSARKLFRNNAGEILTCSAFPWKEKVVFILFAF